jgi:hypothetical protein
LTMSSMVMFHSEVIFMIKEGMCFFEWELLNHVYPIGMLLNDSCHFLVQLSVTREAGSQQNMVGIGGPWCANRGSLRF